MEKKDIKPIPKYILDMIYKRDLIVCPWQDSGVRFYAYLTVWKKELIKVTVAVSTKKKQWLCKQVAIHGMRSENCYVKDMEYNIFTHTYCVGWYPERVQTYPRNYDDGKWYMVDKKYFDPYAPLLNRNVISKFPEYKYSVYKLYKGRDILTYLHIYEEYPQTEYMLKLGLSAYVEHKTILKRLAKDKAFCKWMIKHRKELALPYGRSYNTTTIIEAYKTGMSLNEASDYLFRKRQFEREGYYSPIRELFKGRQLKSYFDYQDKYKVSDSLYMDYLRACTHLGIDMSLKQNRFPKDFMRMHDMRTEEYRAALELENAEKRKAMCEKFALVAQKYLPLQKENSHKFVTIIAKTPNDLFEEGKTLHHCVGSNRYDQRFAEEQSLIFFIRIKDKPEVPFVTLEYSLKTHKVLQCYGSHNSKPDEDTMHYVTKIWLPYANRVIKQIAA